MVGIDTNAEKIAKAKALGIDAHVSAWPGFEAGPVDAVLFAASLHHMHDLDAALNAAANALKDYGLIVADEFAYEAMDARTAEWLACNVREGVAAGFIRTGVDPLLDTFVAGEDPLRAWLEDHQAHVSPSTEMIAHAKSLFPRVEVNSAPYLYRYLVAAAAPTSVAAQWIEERFRKEAAALAAGEIVAIGCRLIMTK